MKCCTLLQFRSYLTIIGGFLIQLTLGAVFTIGNASPYITSYLQAHNEPDARADRILWVRSASMVGQGASVYFGGLLEKRFGAKVGAVVGSLCISGGVALTYFSLEYTLPAVAVTFGLLNGIGFGIAFYPTMACGLKWFPERKGMVGGIIMAGFGLGGFVFDQIQTAFINPQNVKPINGIFKDEELLKRIPYSFLLNGGIFLALQIIGCLFLNYPPKVNVYDESEPPKLKSGDDPKAESAENGKPKDDKPQYRDMTTKESFKTRALYVMILTFMLNTAPVTYVGTSYKDFGLTKIVDDLWLTHVGAIASVFNFGGKLLWGFLSDKFSYRVAVSIICTSMTALILALPYALDGGRIVYGVCIWALYIMFAGNFVVEPVYCHQAFGNTHAGTIYGVVMFGRAFMGIVIALMTTFLFPIVRHEGMFYILAGMTLGGFILTLFFKNPERELIQKA